MKTWGWVASGGAAAALLVGMGSAAQPAATAVVRVAPAEPVVVELFTAQGCEGCAAADRAVEALAETPNVIALTYGVDYWDYLGWADTFAKPEFAARQRTYQAALRLRGVYTPQVVIDGRRAVAGGDPDAVTQAVAEAGRAREFPPEIEFRESGEHVGVGSGRSPVGGARVWLVTYKPGVQTVEVTQGENRGRELRQINVVRELAPLGDWTGRPMLYEMPEAREGAARAVLVQAKADGRILAARAAD